jgi:hypothetical protein
MSIEAMKQALEALEDIFGKNKVDVGAINALRQAIEQAEMVKKGTKAWADTPDNWVDDLRGGAEKPWAKTYAGGEPNYTTPPEKHEPVRVSFIRQLVSINKDGIETWEEKPLYAAPSKREWVGLTAEDLAEIPPSCYEGAIWADAKLKEKNRATAPVSE